MGWSQFRGDQRNGAGKGIPDGAFQAVLEWSFPVPSQGIGGLSATDELVVVSSRDRNDQSDLFFVLDPFTGGLVCKHEIRAEGRLDYGNSPRATPVIGSQYIYLQSAFGELVALDPTDNKVVWSRNLVKDFHGEMPTWGFCSSPLLFEGNLIVQPGGKAASVVSLDEATGEVLWQAAELPAAYASPVVAGMNPVLLVATGAKSIRGIDITNGMRCWEIVPETSGDFMVPTPIVAGNLLLLTSENNGTRMYDLAAKKNQGAESLPLLAKSKRLSGDTHTPVVVGDFLVGVDQDLISLHCKAQLREASAFSDAALDQYTTLLQEDNRLLVCCSNGTFIGIRVEPNGDLVEYARSNVAKESSPIMAHPALVEGLLLVRHSDRISAYRLEQDAP